MSLPRLAIIVPYRERQEHLKQFLPHVRRFFDRDTVAKKIPYSIHIIEQAAGKPFNRGMMKNVGFQITKDTHDYFCFHDVDYLPIRADYSYPDSPTRLIWLGLQRPENYEQFFGAVVAINKADFIAANGYPNEYWGWGFEDQEFAMRCDMAGPKRRFRDGEFQALPHRHAGFNSDETLTPEAMATHALFRQRAPHMESLMRSDGLSSLVYSVKKKTRRIPIGKNPAAVWRYLVDV